MALSREQQDPRHQVTGTGGLLTIDLDARLAIRMPQTNADDFTDGQDFIAQGKKDARRAEVPTRDIEGMARHGHDPNGYANGIPS